MPVSSDPLAGLRGLHVPPPPGGAAGGLLIAVALGLGAAVLLRLLGIAWRMRPSLRRQALASLAATRGLPEPARRVAQARLLRALMSRLAGPVAAGERGERWLARLDAVFASGFFRDGAGRAFGEALYRPEATGDPEHLDRELATLFARLPGNRLPGNRLPGNRLPGHRLRR